MAVQQCSFDRSFVRSCAPFLSRDTSAVCIVDVVGVRKDFGAGADKILFILWCVFVSMYLECVRVLSVLVSLGAAPRVNSVRSVFRMVAAFCQINRSDYN